MSGILMVRGLSAALIGFAMAALPTAAFSTAAMAQSSPADTSRSATPQTTDPQSAIADQANNAARKAEEDRAREAANRSSCVQTGSRIPGNCSVGQKADAKDLLNPNFRGNLQPH